MDIVLFVKSWFINMFVYYTFFKLTNIKEFNNIKIIKIVIASLITTIIYILLKKYLNNIFLIIVQFFIQILFLRILFKLKEELIISNLIANSLVYIAFTLASIIESFPRILLHLSSDLLNLIFILLIELCILVKIFKTKRLNNGLTFLKKQANNDYLNIVMINISICVLLVYCFFGNSNKNTIKQMLPPFIILSVIMVIMIQKTLILYYKQKQMIKTLKEYEDDIKEKDERIKKLSEEKFKISKLNHEFYNRQKALELKVEELVNNANLNMETAGEISVVEQIKNLSKEYSNKLETIKNLDKLPPTEIEEIDDMFKYMQSECNKNNIDFKLQINGNIHHMVNKIIPQNKLVTLIGDHLRDAIIAIVSSKNTYKSIVAILGIKDDCYEFCVNDTGIEFEIETLLKLGLEPVTTHKDTGGSGIGFMTTFETLKETKASLIIREKHKMAENDYTKAVIIRFDGKNEYKIVSYRADEIKKKSKDNRIVLKNTDKK